MKVHELNVSQLRMCMRSSRTNRATQAGMAAAISCVAFFSNWASGQCETPQWSLLSLPSPMPASRWGLAGAFDAMRSKFVIFGGYSNQNASDTWTFDGTSWTLASTQGPSARRNYGMAYDSRRGFVYLFGGFDSTPRNDLWRWDGTAWTQLSPTGTVPDEVDAMAMAYDSGRDRVVVFGGVWPDHYVTHTHEYAPATNTWTNPATTGPSERGYVPAAYDPLRGVTVLFGGNGDNVNNHPNLGDTWEWNGNNWSHKSSTGPSPRRGNMLAYNGARGRVLLFGGAEDTRTFPSPLQTLRGDTWEWDGVEWTRLNIAGPSPRSAGAAVFDSIRGRVLLFGGYGDSQNFNDVWTFTAPPLVKYHPDPVSICPDGEAHYRVIIDGTGTYSFTWQTDDAGGNWVDLADGAVPGVGTVVGSRSDVLRITNYFIATTQRRFRCVVTALAGACGRVESRPASFTVCPADMNCDGGVTTDDLLEYLEAYSLGTLRADLDDGSGIGTPDGGVTIDDLLYFLSRFVAGC